MYIGNYPTDPILIILIIYLKISICEQFVQFKVMLGHKLKKV